ncbi:peptide synthetase 3 [Metarhizium album ARSEF 1941]|uniref:Peptide synthetase 3 n=1 Tax=Metarhizium album (strain ARSEF 1941) TaxID=1081103 RepID=A0A0B2WXA2_METAS|nr:peptide synthetase 3 [Metarhizium album ARSEF 1941]KHN97500.1 peptide synthetase 3 [Metarhizium album ARSEF 1941]
MANSEEDLDIRSSRLRLAEPSISTLSDRSAPLPTSSTIKSVTVELDGIGTSWRDHINIGDVSPSAIFLAAWAMILRAYTDSDSVYFGHAFTTQQRPTNGHNVLLGPQVNLLPCSLVLEGGATILETVREAQQDLNRGQTNQGVTMDEMRSHIGMENNGLSNTCMLFSAGSETFPNLGSGVLAQDIADMGVFPQHDIVIHVSSSKQLVLLYQSHCLSNDLAIHIAGALKAALASIINSPHLTIAEVELFSKVDEKKLLQWNRTAPVALESCLHDLINEQCDLHPDSTAVVAWDGSLTYGQLDCLSNTVAKELRLAGVGPDVFVAVCAERCKWIPVAMLGIIKAGGAFCALDPSHPPGRLRDMCKALRSTVVITTVSDANKAGQLGLTAIVVDDESTMAPGPAKRSLGQLSPSNTRPSNALYSVFTSGSSGSPKGLVMEHGSFASTVLACLKPLDIRPDDRILHFASYAFDLSVFEVLTALVSGASVAIPSEMARMECLPRAATELQATWTFLTPTVARMYRPADFPTLRTVSLGGELLQRSDIELWRSKNLITGYNPAECCPLGISGPAQLSEANFLGWPFASHATWVVDSRDFQKLVPVGAIGELVIEGPAVARSYLHDPENADPDSPFILSPPRWLSRFRGKASSNTRLYRTGDLVRYGCNGALHYIGRKDFQIKIRGQRVELGEIESQLRAALSPGNHHAAVEAVKRDGCTTLIAFLSVDTSNPVAHQDPAPTARLQDVTPELDTYIEGVISRLRGILPSTMIPATFLPVTYIPVSKSGKTDRKQLRALASSLSQDELFRPRAGLPRTNLPETDDERRLQALFARVLGISPDRVGADSDFFRLGGDSVQAMKLLALVSEEELFDLTYGDIFLHPRLRDMVSVSRSRSSFTASDKESVSTDSSLPPFCLVRDEDSLMRTASDQCGVSTKDIEDIYPCTPTQASLMAMAGMAEDPCVSVQSFRLIDGVDSARVKEAWSIAAKGHPILRTRIVQSKTGSFFQVVVRGSICWTDDTGRDGSSRRFRPSFDLGSPLVQLCVVKGRLLVALHHSLYDTCSLSRLLDQVDEAYCQLSVCQLPPMNRYVKHIAESLDAAASFWKAELEDAEPTHFPQPPSKHVDRGTFTPRTNPINARIPTDATRKSNVESQLQLAWAMTCYSFTKNQDVIFGVISDGRKTRVEGVDKMLGPTCAVTPLRVLIDPAQEVTEALEELEYRAEEQAMYTHFGLSRISQLGQNAAAACQFQTLLIVQPDHSEIQGAWFCEHEVLYDSIEPRQHSLTLKCLSKPGFIDMTALFHRSMLPDTQMQQILLRFRHIFAQIHDSSARSSFTLKDIDVEIPKKTRDAGDSNLNRKHVGGDYVAVNLLSSRDILFYNSTPDSQAHHTQHMVDNALEEAALVQSQISSGRTNRGRGNQQLSQASGVVNLVAEIDGYDHIVASTQQQRVPDPETGSQGVKPLTVFLTGANGFIGTELLRQLLESKKIRRVIALVRGSSTQEVSRRTIDSAKRALWWTDDHAAKLDVWPGDLSLPHLGLDQTHWNILEEGGTVDAVIHNGASVHWLKNYAALEATNVRSTAELLRIAVRTPRMRFTYVSSARYQDPLDEVEEEVATQLAAGGIPYSQTKFVSESLVRRAAARMPAVLLNVAVVGLGLVIGTPTEGVVNSDDYVWRMIAACIKAGVCNADDLDRWFPISDVARAARIIIDTALEPMTMPGPVMQVTGGITWRDIWDIVMEMGYAVQSRPAKEWLMTIRRDIEVEQENHPLWTLAHMVEGSIEHAEQTWANSWHGNEASSVRLKCAVKRSLEFLSDIGFIPKSSHESQGKGRQGLRGAFSRS